MVAPASVGISHVFLVLALALALATAIALALDLTLHYGFWNLIVHLNVVVV
jgi:hypothetical protein